MNTFDKASLKGFQGLVTRVLKALNQSKLSYAITGALAVSYFGRPRTTQDIDILLGFKPSYADKISSTLRKAGLNVTPKALAKV